jgi:hypothetical protein
MTEPQTWRHASTCEYERADGDCTCGLATTEGTIAALRSALDGTVRAITGHYAADFKNREKYPSDNDAVDAAMKALDSTASAATEERERIEKPWRDALRALVDDIAEEYPHWGSVEAARALLDNEQ